MTCCKIENANLTDLEIFGARLGGAYIHNVGGPPKGHPNYDPDFKQGQLKFEDCNLTATTFNDCNLTALHINDCNLTDLEITHCNLTGMKIHGILVADLLNAYYQK